MPSTSIAAITIFVLFNICDLLIELVFRLTDQTRSLFIPAVDCSDSLEAKESSRRCAGEGARCAPDRNPREQKCPDPPAFITGFAADEYWRVG
jgi:hypothetical protein